MSQGTLDAKLAVSSARVVRAGAEGSEGLGAAGGQLRGAEGRVALELAPQLERCARAVCKDQSHGGHNTAFRPDDGAAARGHRLAGRTLHCRDSAADASGAGTVASRTLVTVCIW